jgi:TonB family protein
MTAGAQSSQKVAVTPSYPDSTSGLEHLVKDILKAQKAGDGTRAQQLIDSLGLPDYQNWYSAEFDEETAAAGITSYKAGFSSLSAQLARFFLTVQQNQSSVSAVRFDATCDDNASDHTFGILPSRLHAVPLYELRFIKDGRFMRLFAFVYVAGGFRIALLPDPEKVSPHRDRVPSDDTRGAEKNAPASEVQVQRIRQGGAVTAANLIQRVQPEYPEIARRERIQGTVRLHAIIGKDGTIRGLRVMSGACSLSKSAYDAVRKWRYSPTTLEGKPVEVDTTIDVIYSLRQ